MGTADLGTIHVCPAAGRFESPNRRHRSSRKNSPDYPSIINTLALKAIVYLLPLTYTTVGLRAAAYKPLAEFPWYTIPILVAVAGVLAAIGARQFSTQQD